MSDSQHDSRNLTDSGDGLPASAACPNCGSPNVEDYCASCGQRSGTLHIPVRTIVSETMLSIFAFDSRVWQTLFILIRRPGLLTRHYLDGKRARYVAPLRLYLFISFVAFLLLAVFPDSHDPIVNIDSSDSAVTDTTILQAIDESLASVEVDEGGNWISELVRPAQEDPGWVSDRYFRRLPWVYFFVMPVFASVLRLLYRNREPFYVPHLIFTLHVYAAGFLMFAVGLGLDRLLGLDIFLNVAILGMVCHLYLSLRRVYCQGRLRTLVKQCSLLFVHGVVVVIAMTIILGMSDLRDVIGKPSPKWV
ncbi:MAG: DUF3667 domain-containing protein, partial [Rhodothermaceae bacterium]|nr:DUF3667 domain-containing protein [Rhodothermaceae bacterium]